MIYPEYRNELHPELFKECEGKRIHIGLGSVVEKGVTIGKNVFIGHNTVVRSGSVIGDDVMISHNCVIEDGVHIGNAVRIQASSYITRGTKIEDCVFIGPMVCTTNEWKISTHGRDIPHKIQPCLIKYGARIGARVLLMPGVIIHKNALVGAGSLITKDVPERQIWFGHPAEKHGTVPFEELI